MQRLRAFFSILLALILCVSLCLCALSAAVFFTTDRQSAFSAPAMREAIFEKVLAGEDPVLVADLENIPEFAHAQSRYAMMLADWRYADGEPWNGLTEEESRTIARSLLEKNLQQQDEAYSQHEDYQQTLDALCIPLQTALQDVFPPFDLVMHGRLALKMDLAASLIGGSAAAASGLLALVSLALLLLSGPDKKVRLNCLSAAATGAAVVCILCAVSFMTGKFLLALDTPLSLLCDLPRAATILLFIFAAVFVIAMVVLALVQSAEHEETEEDEEERDAPVAESAFAPAQEIFVEEPVQEDDEPLGDTFIAPPITQAELDQAMPKPQTLPAPEALFSGASRYELDLQEPTADMDDLLAQAAGPLFAAPEPLQVPDVDAMDNDAFLSDLQSLFEGRVDNARSE